MAYGVFYIQYIPRKHKLRSKGLKARIYYTSFPVTSPWQGGAGKGPLCLVPKFHYNDTGTARHS